MTQLRSACILMAMAAVLAILQPSPVLAESGTPHRAGEPIRLVWTEGDVGGATSILDPATGEEIGFIDYRQTLRGNLLTAVRLARYLDGSSDEDRAVARVGERLVALEGYSIVRDTDGTSLAEVTIDVAGGRIHGSYVAGGARRTCDEQVDLSAGTYWGPLIFIVLKNFEANATDGRLVFPTVIPTPKPRIMNLELVDRGPTVVRRAGIDLDAVRIDLRPTVHWAIDPILRLFIPAGHFLLLEGEPPALARFAGPRNYNQQEIIVE